MAKPEKWRGAQHERHTGNQGGTVNTDYMRLPGKAGVWGVALGFPHTWL